MHPMFWSWHRPHVWPSKTHYSEQIWIFNQPEITSIKIGTLWKDHEIQMVGGLEHELYFSIQLGMSSSQLTFTPSFFRGVSSNHQPDHAGVQKTKQGSRPFIPMAMRKRGRSWLVGCDRCWRSSPDHRDVAIYEFQSGNIFGYIYNELWYAENRYLPQMWLC